MTNQSQSPIMGCRSTMNDEYQLHLKPLLDRGIKTQENASNVITKLDIGYHSMTWKEFRRGCNKLSFVLSSNGISAGNLISTFMWNTARHLQLYYCVPCMGSVLHPINIRLHPNVLGYIIQHAQPTMIFIDANLLPLFEKIDKNKLTSIKLYIICGDNMQSGGWCSNKLGNYNQSNVYDFDIFISKYGMKGNWNNFKYPVINEKSGCLLCYTSGTTGNPKGVLYSHRQQVIKTLIGIQRISGTSCIMGLAPMFHAAAWGYPYFAMTTGCRYIMTNTCRNFNELFELCLEQKCTAAAGVPTMILSMVEALKKNPNKFQPFKENLKRIGSGGTAIPPYIVNYLWKEWGIEITQGWGMTECMPGCGSSRMNRRHHLYQTDEEQTANQLFGMTPCAILETKLVDTENSNKLIPRNAIDMGELLIRGPCVTKSYYKGGGADSFLDNDWFKTGDIVTISALDEVQIKDRSKDLVKSGGEWISSADMENYVMKLDEIELCCVVGVPHPKWDERPIVIAKIIEKQKYDLNKLKKKILQFIALKYAKFQVPDDVLFWDVIPLTGTGKMSKRTVLDQIKKQKYILPSLKKNKLTSKL